MTDEKKTPEKLYELIDKLNEEDNTETSQTTWKELYNILSTRVGIKQALNTLKTWEEIINYDNQRRTTRLEYDRTVTDRHKQLIESHKEEVERNNRWICSLEILTDQDAQKNDLLSQLVVIESKRNEIFESALDTFKKLTEK